VEAADTDYGGLPDQPGRRRSPLLAVGVVVLIAAAVVIAAVVLSGNDDEPVGEAASMSSAAVATTGTTEPAATTTAPAPPAWTVADDQLPAYISEPLFYESGTTEGDIEIAYVNAEIASIRAVAKPDTIEPELDQYQTGYALAATEDSRQILLEDGQVVEAGGLTRVEIEGITVVGTNEADVDSCYLAHSLSIVVADPSDVVETIRTVHSIQRMVLGDDGQWRLSESLTTIQHVDGFGSCVDVTLTPVQPDGDPPTGDGSAGATG
jgi:hypothetical protein